MRNLQSEVIGSGPTIALFHSEHDGQSTYSVTHGGRALNVIKFQKGPRSRDVNGILEGELIALLLERAEANARKFSTQENLACVEALRMALAAQNASMRIKELSTAGS